MSSRGRSDLHAGLVGERALIGSNYLADPEFRRAYDAEIAPRTRAALARIFAQVAPSPSGVRRALDLGAGTGAAAEAVRAHFGAGVDVLAVDKVAGPGVLLADVTRASRPRGVEGTFDLIVAAHLLNELKHLSIDGRNQLVAGWCDDLLTPDGMLVIVEPALRETSRELLAVRDRLLARRLFVVAPCFFQGPCPALGRPRDWCHDSGPVLESGRSRVDFSYLVLRRSGEVQRHPGLYRIVSDRLEEKGRLRVFGCGPAGRQPIVRLDRNRSRANAAFDEIKRGEAVFVDGADQLTDGLRVGSASIFQRA